MSEADQIVRRLLEDDPTEFVDRQSDLLLISALVRRKWRYWKHSHGWRFVRHGDDDGHEEKITLFVEKDLDGNFSVTASGEKNFEDELQNSNWVDFEIGTEWILKPGEDVDEFVEGVEDDISGCHGPDEAPVYEPDMDDLDD